MLSVINSFPVPLAKNSFPAPNVLLGSSVFAMCHVTEDWMMPSLQPMICLRPNINNDHFVTCLTMATWVCGRCWGVVGTNNVVHTFAGPFWIYCLGATEYYTWLVLLHSTQDHGCDLGGRTLCINTNLTLIKYVFLLWENRKARYSAFFAFQCIKKELFTSLSPGNTPAHYSA